MSERNGPLDRAHSFSGCSISSSTLVGRRRSDENQSAPINRVFVAARCPMTSSGIVFSEGGKPITLGRASVDNTMISSSLQETF